MLVVGLRWASATQGRRAFVAGGYGRPRTSSAPSRGLGTASSCHPDDKPYPALGLTPTHAALTAAPTVKVMRFLVAAAGWLTILVLVIPVKGF